MKKLVFSLALLGLVATNAQAAIVSGTSDASYNFGTDGSIAFTGSSSDYFADIITTFSKTKVSTVFSSSSTTPLVFALYVDLNSALGSYSYDDSRLVYSRTLSSTSGPISLNFVPGNWVIKLLPQLPPFSSTVGSVPVPAAVWMFGSALIGAGALRRKQKLSLAA